MRAGVTAAKRPESAFARIYVDTGYELFINGRFVVLKTLADAVCAAYSERLLKGHFPFACLHIEVDPASLDVNIHPNKTTILCDGEEDIKDVITSAVTASLDKRVIPRVEIETFTETKKDVKEDVSVIHNIFAPEKIMPTELKFEEDVTGLNSHREDIFSPDNFESAFEFHDNIDNEIVYASEDLVADFTDYKLLGVVFNTYLVVVCDDKLYYIDQHAAHERINYEALKNNQNISSQMLLVPHIANLNAHDHLLIMQNLSSLEALGFDIEDFGGNTVKISAVPNIVDQRAIQPLLEDVISVLKEKGDNILMRDKIIRKACKMSVKAGDSLSDTEIKMLIEEIRTSGVIPTCPHGRPVAVCMTKDDLERSFKRKL